MTFEFEQVPPPATAPVDQIAETYGLPDGLRIDPSRGGPYRCKGCNQMTAERMVWVPDFVNKRMSREQVTEMARRVAYNGDSSGWCLPCCIKAWGRKPEPVAIPAIQSAEAKAKTATGFWARLRFVLFG